MADNTNYPFPVTSGYGGGSISPASTPGGSDPLLPGIQSWLNANPGKTVQDFKTLFPSHGVPSSATPYTGGNFLYGNEILNPQGTVIDIAGPQSSPSYTKPPGWSDAQWNAWKGQTSGTPPTRTPGTTPTTNPTTTPTPTPTTTDPFTSWLSQQNVFPYTQSTLGMSGWNPASGYNPAASGYNPSAMPNYTMDTYP